METELKAASPLSVSTEALIEILEGKLETMENLRDVGELESKSLDGPLENAIESFSIDEMKEIFRRYFTVSVEALSQHKREKTFVPKAEQIPQGEIELANTIALLKASDDKTVELDSSSTLYQAAVAAVRGIDSSGRVILR